jgi:hypothetical protein
VELGRKVPLQTGTWERGENKLFTFFNFGLRISYISQIFGRMMGDL